MLLAHNSNVTGIYYGVTLCFVLLFSINTNAQSKNEDDAKSFDTGNVVLHADPRLAILSGYKESVRSSNNSTNSVSGSIHSAKGFRVIIYSGIERAKASATKADFMRRFPGTRVYISYALPQYRVKVGDYATRQEAQEFYRQLSSLYSPCMVVPDIVAINTFRRND